MATQTMTGHGVHTSSKAQHAATDHSEAHHYKRFAVMLGVSFAAMYVLMYAMVDSFSSVFNSINQLYMAGLMAASMGIIEIALMGSMYKNKKLNALILGGSTLALVLFWIGIRTQAGIGDQQFLRSMIPHHSGAILMCNEAQISNPEIASLCKTIVNGQQEEIDQMKAILSRTSK